jgi:predicted PurR-regulated permease PerM
MAGTLVVLSVLFLAYLMVEFYSVLVIMFIAFVLSTALRPLVSLMQRFKIPPALGVIFAYLLLLASIVGIVVLIAPLLTAQITAISTKIPEYYNDFRRLLINSSSAVVRNLSLRLPVNPPLSLIGIAPSDTAAQDTAIAVSQLFTTVTNIGKVFFVIISTLLLGFYWTLDGERISRTMLSLVKPERRESARTLLAEIQAKMGAYIRGQIILDIAVGVMATISYFIIGLDYALVLGILAGILETVPILGPVLGAVPPVLITLSGGDTSALVWVILATVLIQQAEGTFLVPRVMDRTVGVNAVVTLLAFTAFTSVLGLIGGILAVPLAAIVQIIFNRVVFAPVQVSQGIKRRDKLGVLRYEAQALAQTMRLRTRDNVSELTAENEEIEDNLEMIVEDLDGLLDRVGQQQQEVLV